MMRKVYFNFTCVYTLLLFILVCTHRMEMTPIIIELYVNFIYYNIFMVFDFLKV